MMQNITPGSYVTFIGTDGVERTEKVESVRYQSSTPAIWPMLSPWQRAVRRLTPKRWRKPLQPIRPAKPDIVTLGFGDKPTADAMVDAIERHRRMCEAVDGLLS